MTFCSTAPGQNGYLPRVRGLANIQSSACRYRQADDWIFASPRTRGKYPFWPGAVLQKVIQPAASRAGIEKKIGWHTFRHTFSTLLIANGENVKVVQELMRHASSRCTL